VKALISTPEILTLKSSRWPRLVKLARGGRSLRDPGTLLPLGRTPPCTDAVIAAGVARAIFGMKDPDAKVAGKGIEKLTEAGLEVIGPVLRKSAPRSQGLHLSQKSAFAVGYPESLAMSLDGRIATRAGDSKWITGEKSRAYVQKLRANVDAILIGAKHGAHR